MNGTTCPTSVRPEVGEQVREPVKSKGSEKHERAETMVMMHSRCGHAPEKNPEVPPQVENQRFTTELLDTLANVVEHEMNAFEPKAGTSQHEGSKTTYAYLARNERECTSLPKVYRFLQEIVREGRVTRLPADRATKQQNEFENARLLQRLITFVKAEMDVNKYNPATSSECQVLLPRLACYVHQRRSILRAMTASGVDELVDVNWRMRERLVDASSMGDMAALHEPIYLLEMVTRSSKDQDIGRKIMSCSVLDLQQVLANIQDATKQVERIAHRRDQEDTRPSC